MRLFASVGFSLLVSTVIFPCVAAAKPSAPAAAPLRIATFNMKWLTGSARESRMAPWKDEGDLANHRAALARILADVVRADVLCVVEVTSRAALEKLASEPRLRKTGYRVLHLESGDTGTGQDVAFLVHPRVRLDTLEGAVIRRFADTLAGRPGGLKRNDPRMARLTKHAVVCMSGTDGRAGTRLCFMGLHLLAHPDDRGRTARRETQARIAANLVRTEIAARGYTPILLGDLNDFDPDVPVVPATEAPETQTPGTRKRAKKTERPEGPRKVLGMLKDFDPARPGPELFNAAMRIEPVPERYSAYWDKNRNGRREAEEPVSLIDHILVDGSLVARLLKVEIPHAAHDGGTSDHWPVVIELADGNPVNVRK
jgi:endonuclease/exonuclease/phosphatase family metal-dependent hydrolase